MNIGNNIAKYRKEKKLTQEELAKIINVSNKAISSYETNRNIPNIETLILLSQTLDVTINDLLGINKNNSEEIKDKYEKKKNEGLRITLIIGVFSLLYMFFSEYMIAGSLTAMANAGATITMKSMFKVILENLIIYGFAIVFLYGLYYFKVGEKKPLITIAIETLLLIIITILFAIFI